jgi:hypothetical protein
VSETIRLFIGAASDDCDLESQAVAEYTARKYASQPIEIVWMQQSKDGPYAGWNTSRSRTPFSGFRWSLPAMCGFEGRAIYTDTDFIFRADLAELWNQPIPGVLLTKKSRKPGGKLKTCCIMFDCERAKAHIGDLPVLKRMDDPQGHYSRYFQQHGELVDNFDGDWNTIDPEGDLSDPRIKAIHYSRIECQPAFRHAQARLKAEGRSHWYTGPTFRHPNLALVELFDAELQAAIEAGYTLDRYRGEYVGLTRRAFTYKFHKGVAEGAA